MKVLKNSLYNCYGGVTVFVTIYQIHIDTNRSNNNVSNLRWVTRLENNNNPITLSKLKLSARDISKLVLQLKNGVIVKEYNSINEAAKINGFSPIAIC
jgi:putative HNH endonuclease